MDKDKELDTIGLGVIRGELIEDGIGFSVEDWSTITRLALEEMWRHGQGYKKSGYGGYLTDVLYPKCKDHYLKLLARQKRELGAVKNDD